MACSKRVIQGFEGMDAYLKGVNFVSCLNGIKFDCTDFSIQPFDISGIQFGRPELSIPPFEISQGDLQDGHYCSIHVLFDFVFLTVIFLKRNSESAEAEPSETAFKTEPLGPEPN